jgi:hypothetical protein
MICDLRIRLRSLELLAEPFFMAFFWIKSRVLPGFMSGKAGPTACRRLHEKKGDGVNASPGTLAALVLRTPPLLATSLQQQRG